MDKTIKKAFKLMRRVKSITFSTINENEPASRIIDLMLVRDEGLYFTTARGKQFYKQLQKNNTVALCCMTKDYISIRIVGSIKFFSDRQIIDDIFEENPAINELYPGETREILEPFVLYKGRGEIFDLSAHPVKRERFAFGGDTVNPSGYLITERCTSCGVCYDVCPFGAVIVEGNKYSIDGSLCIECGRCYEACPVDAISGPGGI